MDATCEDVHDVAYGVVSYPVGPDRGMPGARRMTWNGSAVAIAKRRPCAPDFRRLKRRLIVAHGEAGRWSIWWLRSYKDTDYCIKHKDKSNERIMLRLTQTPPRSTT